MSRLYELEIESPTSIRKGKIVWCNLDTKLVGSVKWLIEQNCELQKNINMVVSDNRKAKERNEYQEKMLNKIFNILLKGELSNNEKVWEIYQVCMGEDKNE